MKSNALLMAVVLGHTPSLLAADAKPTDAAAPVPPASYRSAFQDYRSATEAPLADWRALNDDVAATGGHMGIMRGPAKQPASAGAMPAPPQPPAHAGHH